VAQDLTALIKECPEDADPAIIDDLPNEYGVPNHDPDGTGQVDNHDFLTGTDTNGNVYGGTESTCNDWTSATTRRRPALWAHVADWGRRRSLARVRQRPGRLVARSLDLGAR
jgi:hypothetical protein